MVLRVTEQQQIDRGRRMAMLLEDPVFEDLMQEVSLDIAMAAMKAESEKKRTDLYFENRALARIVGRMKKYLSDARMLESGHG
jgi:hypothetical protein